MSCIVTDAGDTFLSHSFIGRAIVVIEGIIIIIIIISTEEEEKKKKNGARIVEK